MLIFACPALHHPVPLLALSAIAWFGHSCILAHLLQPFEHCFRAHVDPGISFSVLRCCEVSAVLKAFTVSTAFGAELHAVRSVSGCRYIRRARASNTKCYCSDWSKTQLSQFNLSFFSQRRYRELRSTYLDRSWPMFFTCSPRLWSCYKVVVAEAGPATY